MPLYEYRCSSCGRRFEKMVSFSATDQNPVCPYCQSKETQKQLSTFASLGGSAGSTAGGSCGSSGGRFT